MSIDWEALAHAGPRCTECATPVDVAEHFLFLSEDEAMFVCPACGQVGFIGTTVA